jgi:hypothetical protein
MPRLSKKANNYLKTAVMSGIDGLISSFMVIAGAVGSE